MSKTQIDRLGERLRRGHLDDADLRLLDEYRKSFAQPYTHVIGVLRDELGLAPTGRPAKSTQSIVDKLKRETIRLSQIQDVAGCRVVTTDIVSQNGIIEAVCGKFPAATVVDRREQPSHGYRAVHVLVAPRGQHVEIQIRTALQQLWAELSERLSDVHGIEVKYGGGSATTRALLDQTSLLVRQIDDLDLRLVALDEKVFASAGGLDHPDLTAELQGIRAEMEDLRRQTRVGLQETITRLSALDA